jgi:hypothetical protein
MNAKRNGASMPGTLARAAVRPAASSLPGAAKGTVTGVVAPTMPTVQ